MAKRFFETSIWTNNQWFRKLKPESKLFWFYLLGSCDNVGVWEEDWDLASFIIGTKLNPAEILQDINDRVCRISTKKMWIIDFCDFQYKGLRDNPQDKPRLSYIELLKKHDIWEEYLKGMDTLLIPLPYPLDTLKEKEKDKVQDKDREKEEDQDENNYNIIAEENF